MAAASASIPSPSSSPCSSPPTFKSAASTPAGFPVPAATFDVDVLRIPTRFVVAAFGDCFLVAATQTGALGTVMRVSRCGGVGIGGGAGEVFQGGEDASFGDDGDGDRPQSQPPLSSFDVATLSGRRDSAILEASARSLAASLASRGVRTPVTLVCLALRDDTDAGAAREVTRRLREAIEASAAATTATTSG